MTARFRIISEAHGVVGELSYNNGAWGIKRFKNEGPCLFMRNWEVTDEDAENFVRSRIFEESNQGAAQMLEAMGLDHYDPLAIITFTGGRTLSDDCYLVSIPVSTG